MRQSLLENETSPVTALAASRGPGGREKNGTGHRNAQVPAVSLSITPHNYCLLDIKWIWDMGFFAEKVGAGCWHEVKKKFGISREPWAIRAIPAPSVEARQG